MRRLLFFITALSGTAALVPLTVQAAPVRVNAAAAHEQMVPSVQHVDYYWHHEHWKHREWDHHHHHWRYY